MRLRFTPPSQADLRAITLHFLDVNVRTARSVVRSIKSRCGRLTRFPYSGQVMDPELHGDKRRLIAGRYIVIYRVREQTVEVLRVLHGARDIDALLKQDVDDGPDDA